MISSLILGYFWFTRTNELLKLDNVSQTIVSAVVCAHKTPVLFVEYFDTMITEYQRVQQKVMVFITSAKKNAPSVLLYSRKKTELLSNLNIKLLNTFRYLIFYPKIRYYSKGDGLSFFVQKRPVLFVEHLYTMITKYQGV